VNTEKQKLIQELLDDQSANRRQATFLAGRQILRQRRWRRAALRGALVVASILVITTVVFRNTVRRTPAVSALQPPTPEPVLKSLTDAELLALFPDTAVGLITLDDGRKRLIFPRAGDEARFVKRM
jgi:hypothetical protein